LLHCAVPNELKEDNVNKLIIILGCALALAACDMESKPNENVDRAGSERNANSREPAAASDPNAPVREEPDNTGVNERDRRGTVTPGDHGGSEAESASECARSMSQSRLVVFELAQPVLPYSRMTTPHHKHFVTALRVLLMRG
jgi:hypothetical protein